VSLLVLDGRPVAKRGVQPARVEPGDVVDGRELELGVGLERTRTKSLVPRPQDRLTDTIARGLYALPSVPPPSTQRHRSRAHSSSMRP
jgi:hypothetical protein